MNDPLATHADTVETGGDLAQTASPATQPIDISALITQQTQELP